jgi:hypothetical protein
VIYGLERGERAGPDANVAYMAFGRQPAWVAEIAMNRSLMLRQENQRTVEIDIGASPRARHLCGEEVRGTRQAFADFRERFGNLQEVTTTLLKSELEALIAALESAPVPSEDKFAKDIYWIQFFKGFIQYMEKREVTRGNNYIDYMIALTNNGKYDPGMRATLSNEQSAVARLRPRFDAFASALRTKWTNNPVILYNPLAWDALLASGYPTETLDPALVFVDQAGRRYWVPSTDGHHRLAGLYMSGAKTCRGVVAWCNAYPLGISVSGSAKGDAAAWADPMVDQLIEGTVAQLFA